MDQCQTKPLPICWGHTVYMPNLITPAAETSLSTVEFVHYNLSL